MMQENKRERNAMESDTNNSDNLEITHKFKLEPFCNVFFWLILKLKVSGKIPNLALSYLSLVADTE